VHATIAGLLLVVVLLLVLVLVRWLPLHWCLHGPPAKAAGAAAAAAELALPHALRCAGCGVRRQQHSRECPPMCAPQPRTALALARETKQARNWMLRGRDGGRNCVTCYSAHSHDMSDGVFDQAVTSKLGLITPSRGWM
jgi:hypothetical protein